MPTDQGFRGLHRVFKRKEFGTTNRALISLNSLIPFLLINPNWALMSYRHLLCLPGSQNGLNFAHCAVTVPSSGGTAPSVRNSSGSSLAFVSQGKQAGGKGGTGHEEKAAGKSSKRNLLSKALRVEFPG